MSNVPPELTDTAHVAAWQAGDPHGFAALYDAYVSRLYAYCYYRVQHRETAEDLTSQIFLRVLAAGGTFDGQRGPFSAWLYAIARNVVADHFRGHRREDSLADWEQRPAAGSLEQQAANRWQVGEVRRYLDSLEEWQREILILRLWEEWAFEDIATLTGKSAAACRMLCSRALRKMREDLAGILAVAVLGVLYINGGI
jgi:RNA polymerase sigma factor (sigma-70 family)